MTDNRPINFIPSFSDVAPNVAAAFAETLHEHIAYVREAGEMLGVDKTQLLFHDESKWSVFEFSAYANHFKGGGVPDAFAKAWLHHLQNNPHHWQHWIFPDGFTPKGSNVENGVIEMPKNFALEMIADWMGANKTYAKSWDMAEWLQNNFSKVKLHSITRRFVVSKLHELSYTFIN